MGRGREGSAIGAGVGAIIGGILGGPVGVAKGAFYGAGLGSGYDAFRASQRARKANLPNFGTGSGSPRYGFGALQTTTSNEIPIAVVYGRLKVGGNNFFQSGPGTTVERGTGLCEGEVDRIYDVRINNKPATNFFPGTNFDSFVGTTTQTVDSRFSADVKGLRNLAYIAQTLQASEKLSGAANLTAWVDGLKVKIWDGTAWSGSTFSRNPAAILRDYLIDAKYGVGLDETLIDDDAFGEVYDFCETLITNGDGDLDQFHDIDGERCTLNSPLRRPATNIRQLAQSFQPSVSADLAKVELLLARAGTPSLTSWQVRIFPDDATNNVPDQSAAALATATVAEGDGPDQGPSATPGPTLWTSFVFSSPPSLTAGTTYWIVLDPVTPTGTSNNDYFIWRTESPNETGKPDYTRGRAARFLGEYGSWKSLPADDRAFRTFMNKQPRFRCDLAIDSFRPHLDHIDEILSTCNSFLVVSGSKLKMRVEKDEAAVATLTEAEIIGRTFAFSQTGASELVNRSRVQYMEPLNFFTKAEAQAEDKVDQDRRGVISRDESILGITSFNQASRMAEFLINVEKFASVICSFRVDIRQLKFEPGDVIAVTQPDAFFVSAKFRITSIQESEGDEMEIVCRAHNASLYNDLPGSGLQIWDPGDPADPFGPPENVENCQVNIDGDRLIITWDAVADVDFSYYEIRRGSSWEVAEVVETGITGTRFETLDFPPSGTHTFFVKAFDTTGIESVEACSDTITISGIFNRNIIKEFDEWTKGSDLTGTFGGDAYQEMSDLHDSTIHRKAITLETTELWNNKTGTWSAAETNGDTWERPVSTVAGTYETTGFDLESKMTVTIRIDAEYLIEPGGTIDVEIALSDDDISYTAFTAFVVGEYETRYYKFKLTLTSPGGATRVKVLDFKTTADVPDRVIELKSQTVSIGGTSFSFSPAFTTLTSIVVTVVGSGTKFAQITTQSTTGFTVKVFDDTGADVGGTINWQARGFGEVS